MYSKKTRCLIGVSAHASKRGSCLNEGAPAPAFGVAFARSLIAFACLACLGLPLAAAINAYDLGPSYDSTRSNVVFRVHSSRATRIEVDLYASPIGSPEGLRLPLKPDSSTNIFSGSIPVATLQAAGITGPVYYGYRAWGPNWPFSSSWTKGSDVGFISDVDAHGNRFNANKLLIDPYAHEISHDPMNATWADGSGTPRDLTTAISTAVTWLLGASFGFQRHKPLRAQKDDIIYEVNVGGLTENDTTVTSGIRGTYAGAAHSRTTGGR